jgi:hypothetical protein
LAAAAAIVVAQQLAIARLGHDGIEAAARRTIFLVTTALLIVMALHFRRFAGAWLVAAGIVLNFLPMAYHGGLMPVPIEVIQASGAFPEITEADLGRQVSHGKDIVLRRLDIRLEALSDRYHIRLPAYGDNIYSLGDFVLFAGVGLAAAESLAAVFRPTRAHGRIDNRQSAIHNLSTPQ